MVATLDARETMYQHFVDALPLAGPLVEANVTFDNEIFDPPVDENWARLAVRHRESNQETLGAVGNRKFLREGGVIIQIFVPLNKEGVRGADAIAQAVRAVFEGVTLSSNAIRFNDAVVREIGPDRSWYQVNVEAFFNYTERK